MGTEIERKFLVCGDEWRKGAVGVEYRQGYLPTSDACVVRIRTAGAEALLTVKGRTVGIFRQEFEYSIPFKDAEEMLATLCNSPLIEKKRFTVQHGVHQWVIDEFSGDNQGLIVAEVELSTEDESVSLPTWIGKEVSDDPRFFNVNLVTHPFRDWQDSLDANET